MIAAHGGVTKGQVMWLRDIPERSDVEQMLQARVPHLEILRWLREDCGYGSEATVGRLKAYVESPHCEARRIYREAHGRPGHR